MTEEPRKSACDYLGDCFIAIMQECAFWVDVLQTTFELDEESVRRDAEEKLK